MKLEWCIRGGLIFIRAKWWVKKRRSSTRGVISNNKLLWFFIESITRLEWRTSSTFYNRAIGMLEIRLCDSRSKKYRKLPWKMRIRFSELSLILMTWTLAENKALLPTQQYDFISRSSIPKTAAIFAIAFKSLRTRSLWSKDLSSLFSILAKSDLRKNSDSPTTWWFRLLLSEMDGFLVGPCLKLSINWLSAPWSRLLPYRRLYKAFEELWVSVPSRVI